MNSKQPFKWRHFQAEIILLNVSMIRKGQIKNVKRNDVLGQIDFIHSLFEIAV